MNRHLIFVMLAVFYLATCQEEQKAKSISEPKIPSKVSPNIVPFEEKKIGSVYGWSFFDRERKYQCFSDFEETNYEEFNLRKKGPRPNGKIWDIASCKMHFYTIPNGTHIFNGFGGWFDEWPKAITKIICTKNKCEMYFWDYMNSNPMDGTASDVLPRKGKFTFVILDSNHFELVDYPKDVISRDHDFRGKIYRYFPQNYELPGKAFCQMDKEELIKNRDIYPPNEIECINPDDVRKAEENGKTD